MQDFPLQVLAQPFVKLAQANLQLLTQSTSPEFMQPDAFARLIQGLVKNYTEFLAELGQGSMAMMSEGQAALTRQVQEAADSVVDVTEARAGRVRRAA